MIKKSQVSKAVTFALTAALVATSITAPEVAAKQKKVVLSSKSVSLAIAKTKKVKLKNAKASQVKKLTAKVKNKKVATAKVSKKTTIAIKGISAGSTKVTAKVKLKKKIAGKKSYTLTVKVKVTGAKAPANQNVATAAPAAKASEKPASTVAPTASAATATPVVSEEPTETYPAYARTPLPANADFSIDTTGNAHLSAQPDLTLPSLCKEFDGLIPRVGFGVTYDELLAKDTTCAFIAHHCNTITMTNEMKPDALMVEDSTEKLSEAKIGTKEVWVPENYASFDENKDADGNLIVPEFNKANFERIDKILKICKDNGIGVRFHTLLWQSQMPKYFFCPNYDTSKGLSKSKELLLCREEMYIHNVLDYALTSPYASALYTIDVANEYVHMQNAAFSNYWKDAFGTSYRKDCEYVKCGFVWAKEQCMKYERDDISLIYNDYNTYESSATANIIELIEHINTVDQYNKIGKVCDGVGMQSHFNDPSGSVETFITAVKKFAAKNFEIQLTEMDVTDVDHYPERTKYDLPIATDENGNPYYEVITETSGGTDIEDIKTKNKEVIENYNDYKNYVLNTQGAFYKSLFDGIIKAKKEGANITSITVWNICDAVSWRPNYYPTLFGLTIADKKPAFDGLIAAAKEAKGE
ncbi:endo-1,4-beta-xylanase [Eubacterium xylanophilum]|uniref:endo-1,4-beta-xylanase n=1 Tax=Eubacterium xylanophilum TaxID=39497 RepID=UPI00047B1EB1|nr:endo-1,4-beta-xylanase [Eubacterium xylanophilum]